MRSQRASGLRRTSLSCCHAWLALPSNPSFSECQSGRRAGSSPAQSSPAQELPMRGSRHLGQFLSRLAEELVDRIGKWLLEVLRPVAPICVQLLQVFFHLPIAS